MVCWSHSYYLWLNYTLQQVFLPGHSQGFSNQQVFAVLQWQMIKFEYLKEISIQCVHMVYLPVEECGGLGLRFWLVLVQVCWLLIGDRSGYLLVEGSFTTSLKFCLLILYSLFFYLYDGVNVDFIRSHLRYSIPILTPLSVREKQLYSCPALPLSRLPHLTWGTCNPFSSCFTYVLAFSFIFLSFFFPLPPSFLCSFYFLFLFLCFESGFSLALADL